MRCSSSASDGRRAQSHLGALSLSLPTPSLPISSGLAQATSAPGRGPPLRQLHRGLGRRPARDSALSGLSDSSGPRHEPRLQAAGAQASVRSRKLPQPEVAAAMRFGGREFPRPEDSTASIRAETVGKRVPPRLAMPVDGRLTRSAQGCEAHGSLQRQQCAAEGSESTRLGREGPAADAAEAGF